MPNSSNNSVGIIGAMQVEVQHLSQTMNEEGEVEVFHTAGMTFESGTLNGKPVVVVRSGIGMVNAALCAQVLIEHFGVSCIVNTGVAGSLDAKIGIGDIVVATDAVNHVMDVQNLGYKPGQNPDFDLVAFPASPALTSAALKAAKTLNLTAHEGRIASGDRFVRESDDKERIVNLFNASCCEMEGAAIAQACYLSNVPYLIVRAISDKADGSASVDYPTFEAKAAKDCASLTMQLLTALE